MLNTRYPRWNQLALVALLLLGVLAAALLLLDLQAARSETRTESQVGKYSAIPQNGAPPEAPGQLGLHVPGDDPMAASLRRELARRLENAPTIGRVTLVDAMPEGIDHPVAIAEIGERQVTWTPLYAHSTLTVRMLYASDGDLSWRDQTSVVMGSREGRPQVRVRGELQIEDTTRGILSRPAYQRHLGQQMAAAVSDSLTKQLENPR